ncbi:N-acetyltransferase [Streptomyces syringium]|uniref:N-acetyltransferase n=1 Tax=Streptomyces syringium TaxID=76729 RepID=UPI003D8CE7F7
MTLKITTAAQRPELLEPLWAMPDTWPEYVQNDPIGWAHFARIPAVFPDFVLIATDDVGEVVARAFSVPFALNVSGRHGLPAAGWDQILLWAFSDHRKSVRPDTVSAIDITVRPDHLGRGLSATMLAALRDNAGAAGFAELVAPVRPTGKGAHPRLPMAEYAALTRPDGLPVDPWLRTHVRAGGVIDSIAPTSMTVPGTLAQWRTWTGLPFDTQGPVDVPGALTPVHCEPDHDYAVSVEPNVWVRHSLV